MKNMGAAELALVRPEFDWEQARRMAVHAADVLRSAAEVESLAEAISGCTTVVGTTCRPGAFRRRARDVREVAAELARSAAVRGTGPGPLQAATEDSGLASGGATAADVAASSAALAEEAGLAEPTGVAASRPTAAGVPSGPAAFVFGAEDTGLTNDEVAVCHQLAYIPAASAYPSLNLAQAVLLCLYEVRRQWAEWAGESLSRPVPDRGEGPAPADAAAVESMLVALEDALTEIGFLAEKGSAGVMASIRAVLARSGLDVREVRILHGIARQIRWFGRGGHEVVRDKRRRGEKLR